MNKIFFKSDNLLVPIDTVDTRTLGDPVQDFYRHCIRISAHPGVNAEDILSEVQDIEANGAAPNSILTTTLTEKDDYVVALTYNGFVKLALGYEGKNGTLARYTSVAQELVYNRDHK